MFEIANFVMVEIQEKFVEQNQQLFSDISDFDNRLNQKQHHFQRIEQYLIKESSYRLLFSYFFFKKS